MLHRGVERRRHAARWKKLETQIPEIQHQKSSRRESSHNNQWPRAGLLFFCFCAPGSRSVLLAMGYGCCIDPHLLRHVCHIEKIS